MEAPMEITAGDLTHMITDAAREAVDKAMRTTPRHEPEVIRKLETEQDAVALAKSVSSGKIASPLAESDWNMVIEKQAQAHFPEFEGMGWSWKTTAKAISRFLGTPTGAALSKAATTAKFGSVITPPRAEEPVCKMEREAAAHPLLVEIQKRADALYPYLEAKSPQQRFAHALSSDPVSQSLYRVVREGAETDAVAKMAKPDTAAAATDARLNEYSSLEKARALQNPTRKNWPHHRPVSSAVGDDGIVATGGVEGF
jgi:hypothetical protein